MPKFTNSEVKRQQTRKFALKVNTTLTDVVYMGRKYLNRIADGVLSSALESSGAVLIEGPKWCGKTWTATKQAGSVLDMTDPENKEALRTSRIQRQHSCWTVKRRV
jgi:hypothetical protein